MLNHQGASSNAQWFRQFVFGLIDTILYHKGFGVRDHQSKRLSPRSSWVRFSRRTHDICMKESVNALPKAMHGSSPEYSDFLDSNTKKDSTQVNSPKLLDSNSAVNDSSQLSYNLFRINSSKTLQLNRLGRA